jgi:hypothetical protein
VRSLFASGLVAVGLLGASVVMLTSQPTSAPGAAAVIAAPTATAQPPTPTPAVAPTATPPSPTAIAVPTLIVAAAVIDGRTLFQRKGCIACHSVTNAGLKSLATFAPELSALPQVAPLRRPGLSAEAYVRESILQPEAFRVPGFTDIEMPALPIADDELDMLIEFLLGAPTD